MATLSVHHKVEDYSKWRAVFDEMNDVRRRYGQTGFRVLRTAADPNEIVILTEWPTVEQARAYATSNDLKDGMQKAGVASQPEVLFLEEL
jgi:heme-degrading monooxygenase HmoA